MKIYYSKYKLTPKNFLAKYINTEGVLFSFKENESIKYSLYHPIESLGDMSVNHVLKNFKKLVFDKRVLNRIYTSSLDEFEDQKIKVSCYRFCRSFEEANTALETVVKVKIQSVNEIVEGINSVNKKKYILDANGQLQANDLNLLKERNLNAFIKYLEDPTKDTGLQSDSLSIASDFINYKSYDYRVLKPTGFCHSIENKLNKPSVVTSYLDHPLGQIIAAKFAQDNNVQEPCGLMTHKVFEENAYSGLLSQSGDFEFQDYEELFKVLNKEKWKRV